MIYYVMKFLHENYDIPGMELYRFISFRAAMAVLTSLFIGLVFGKKIIIYIRKKQLGETVRELGLTGQKEKEGTPTMGGIIIILATIIPVLLFAKWDNIYVIMLLISTLWMGLIGFLDDYLKIYKKNKEGLKGIFKIIGQIGLGLFIGCMMYFNSEITIREKASKQHIQLENGRSIPNFGEPEKATKTTIPLIKNNEFDYKEILTIIGFDNETAKKYAWLVFITLVIIIITAVSNGANLTDGIDGLAAGSSVIIVGALALFAWISGNIILADYLNVMFLPNTGEVVIFSAAFMGALIGFLWYNTYPAQVFMGDTGSLTIGGIIAVMAIILRKEMIIPVLCGIFLAENLSVMLQVAYFKYTKKRFGEGRRILLMSPLHHHYQKKGYHESKIVTRFLIIGVILAIICITTLKVR